jgi:hypothetical protein
LSIDERRKRKGKLAIGLRNIAPAHFLFAVQAAAESMNKSSRFRKLDLSVSSKNHLNQRDNGKNGQRPLDFNRSIYADDAAFIVLLSRAELIEGSTFITKEFARFR